jgi:eukaryotic-like serine/threonine-protein kinase
VPTSTIANRYQLAQLLRRDGSGEVWAARDRRLKRDVAVKLAGAGAAGGPQRREEFEAEARSVARLTHPNIALVYDSGEHEGRPYLVMERLPERTLADEVAEGPLAPERARRVAADVLAALAAAHQAGLVHGALTSESVLVCPDGRAKVSGFGVAQAAGSSDAGLVEQDLVAVGVLLDEALSGGRSAPGDGLQPPTPDARPLAERRPGLPAPLVEVVERAVGRAPT